MCVRIAKEVVIRRAFGARRVCRGWRGPSVLVIVLWTLCLSATRIGLQGVHDVIDNGGFGAG